MLIVELERFELSSKRGINLLSTCLSSPVFSSCGKTEATCYNLSPSIFICRTRPPSDYLRYLCATLSNASKPQLPGDVSSKHLVWGL